jgi:hypothetical protein
MSYSAHKSARQAVSSDPDVVQITKSSEIDRMIAHAASIGQTGCVTLLREGVRAGLINAVFVDRYAEAPMRKLKRSARPTCVVLGDDDYQSTGPLAWTSFMRLSHWAKGALIHASGGDAPSYRMAIRMTLQHQRLLLVETSSAMADTWAAALNKRGIRPVGLLPSDGGPHPVLPPRSAMQ